MIKYLLDNKEWIFSGIGVLIISSLIAYFLNKKKSAKSKKRNTNFYTDTSKNSSVNNIQGDKVNINQTIINHVKETINEKEIEKTIKPADDLPEFEKAKRKITFQKARIRTYINAILASARAQDLDSKLEIRHITDVVEELINENYDRTLEEVMGMKEEGLIKFEFTENEILISPYTKVLITNKFYSSVL